MTALKLRKIEVLTYGLPVLIILSSIAIALSPLLKQYPELSIAITYDLTLSAPLLFLILSRKSAISKLKAIPLFITGMVVASYVMPESGQEHLSFIKLYIFPIIELGVFIFLTRNIYKGIKIFKTNATYAIDFYTISKKSAEELFGKSKFAAFFSSEITMFYYAFFSWGKIKKAPNQFTNYKENASMALAGAFLMVVCIETYAFHILLAKWSNTAAWIFTATSIYTAFMIIGHIKALLHRPSILTSNKLLLKNGLIANINIHLEDIETIEGNTKEMISKEKKIGNLGIHKESTNHNIAIYFKKPQTIEKMYGFTEECDILLLHMDEKKKFIENINHKLQQD